MPFRDHKIAAPLKHAELLEYEVAKDLSAIIRSRPH